MTQKDAKQLLPGTVVMWYGNTQDLGTVRRLSPSKFYIDWNVRKRSGWVTYGNAKNVSIR